MQCNKGRVIMKFYSHYQGWWLVFHDQLDPMAISHSVCLWWTPGRSIRDMEQTISRQGNHNNCLQMKPIHTINYKSRHKCVLASRGMTARKGWDCRWQKNDEIKDFCGFLYSPSVIFVKKKILSWRTKLSTLRKSQSKEDQWCCLPTKR